MRKKYPSRSLWAFSFMLLAACGLHAQSDSSNKMENQYKNIQPGTDPHAFANAQSMYQTAANAPFDQAAAAMITSIGEKINAGMGIDSDELFAKLLALNPYRSTAEVQAAANGWIETLAKKTAAGVTRGADRLFTQANQEYVDGKYDQAVSSYRKLLKNSPAHCDARNNLALTLIHQGMDLPAQIELEVIKKNQEGYVPALINLTVVYERMGQSEKAQQLARKAAELQKNIPAAIYNNLWYASLTAPSPDLGKKLDELLEISNRPPYRQLKRLMAGQINPAGADSSAGKKDKSFVEKGGLVGALGLDASKSRRLFAFVLFLVLSLVLLAIAGTRRKHPIWTFFILGSILFPLYWGALTGPGTYFVFIIIGCWLSFKISKG